MRTYRERYIAPLATTRRFVDFYNYGPDDRAVFPPGTGFIRFPDGYIAYYGSVSELYNAARIRPALTPQEAGP
jgi:hypothetical protein